MENWKIEVQDRPAVFLTDIWIFRRGNNNKVVVWRSLGEDLAGSIAEEKEYDNGLARLPATLTIPTDLKPVLLEALTRNGVKPPEILFIGNIEISNMNITDTIRKAEEEFEERCRRWAKSQQEGGSCACLGNCQVCGWHKCHGCLCNFKSHIKSTHLALLKAVESEVGEELKIQQKVQEKSNEVVAIGRARVAGMVAEKYTRIGMIIALKDVLSLLRQAREELTDKE